MYNENTPCNCLIPEDRWEQTGPQNDPQSRLLCNIRINGTDMHLEAIQVKTKKDGTQAAANGTFKGIFKSFQETNMTDRPFRTTKIGGHTYCLFATPYLK